MAPSFTAGILAPSRLRYISVVLSGRAGKGVLSETADIFKSRGEAETRAVTETTLLVEIQP